MAGAPILGLCVSKRLAPKALFKIYLRFKSMTIAVFMSLIFYDYCARCIVLVLQRQDATFGGVKFFKTKLALSAEQTRAEAHHARDITAAIGLSVNC